MKQDFILDPLWITKGKYLDSEYFNYILLDASLKYKKEIAEDKIDHFYEVMFHILNLNNLAVNGKLFTSKFKEIWRSDRLFEIQEDLKKLYDISQETATIFKNANYVFLNVIIDYMKIHLSILETINIICINPNLHLEKEIFIITTKLGSMEYVIWRLCEDAKKDFGYSFKKIKRFKIKDLSQDALHQAIANLDDDRLSALSSQKNVCFSIINEDEPEDTVAKTVKDIVLLNKGIAKTINFEPYIMIELYHHIWIEKMMPFTLDQWKFENA